MTDLNTLFTNLKQRNPNQEPFHQAVEEVFMSWIRFWRKTRNTPNKACLSVLLNRSV